MSVRNLPPTGTEFPQEKVRDTEAGVWETSNDKTKTKRKVTVKEKHLPGEKTSVDTTSPIHYRNKVEKARRIQELLAMEPEELYKEAPYACDSIGALKSQAKYIPTTPDLDLPDPAFNPLLKKTNKVIETKVIQSLEDLREANLCQQNLEMDFLTAKTENLQVLHQELALKLQDNAQRLAHFDNWTLLRSLIDGVISAGTVLAGIALAPATVGFCMIGMGMLSLTNLAFSQLGVWESIAKTLAKNDLEMQKVLTTALPGALTLVCALVGPLLLANGMFKLGFSATRDLPVIFETTMAFTNGIISVGGAYSTMKLEYSQADLVEIQQKVTENTVLSERIMNMLEAMLKELDFSASRVTRILKMSTRMQRKISRIRG